MLIPISQKVLVDEMKRVGNDRHHPLIMLPYQKRRESAWADSKCFSNISEIILLFVYIYSSSQFETRSPGPGNN